MRRSFFAVLLISVSIGSVRAESDAFVRVNQVGYRPSGAKIAIAFGRAALPAKFQVVDAATERVALEGDSRLIAGSWGEFSHHVELDFSALTNEGEYKIRQGTTESPPFR